MERLGFPLDSVNVEVGAYPGCLDQLRRRLYVFASLHNFDENGQRPPRLEEARMCRFLGSECGMPAQAGAVAQLCHEMCAALQELRSDNSTFSTCAGVDFQEFLLLAEICDPLVDVMPVSCDAQLTAPDEIRPGGDRGAFDATLDELAVRIHKQLDGHVWLENVTTARYNPQLTALWGDAPCEAVVPSVSEIRHRLCEPYPVLMMWLFRHRDDHEPREYDAHTTIVVQDVDDDSGGVHVPAGSSHGLVPPSQMSSLHSPVVSDRLFA